MTSVPSSKVLPMGGREDIGTPAQPLRRAEWRWRRTLSPSSYADCPVETGASP
jgi:hypothetical protein